MTSSTRPRARVLKMRAALAVLLTACGSTPDPVDPGDPGDPIDPRPVVATIRVEPHASEIVVGQTLQLVATPLSMQGVELKDRALTWTSDNAARATITVDGTVTAITEGAVVLTAASEGASTDVPLVVLAVPAVSLFIDTDLIRLDEGASVTLAVEVRDSLDRPLSGRVVTWSVDDPSVATVDDAGSVTGLAEGITRVVARHATLEASASVDVRVVFVADVLFDAVEAPLPLPRIYRYDPRDSTGVPEVVLSTGTWEAKPSPDGLRIAFTCTDPGPAICTADRDGGDIHVLTSGDLFYEDQATWSPDGEHIAFRRWPQGGTPGQSATTDIWVMDRDGLNQLNVTGDTGMQHEPAWSPVLAGGTTRIAYSQTDLVGGYVTARVFTMRDDGTDRRPETPGGDWIASEPAWSPDGLDIVYQKYGGGVLGDLWVTHVGLAREEPLLPAPLSGEQHSPTYSPDGRHVLFASAHEPSPDMAFREQLYTVRADGTGLVRRTSDALAKQHPVWLPRP